MLKYMISAPQPEAVESGLETLKGGGNVIDAAISAGLVQTAVDPQMCGIAGFGSCHIYLVDGTHKIIDFHGRAPLATKSNMWEDLIEGECDDGFGFLLRGQVNEIGYQCMTTPMTLKAFDDILKQFGTISMSEALKPAINYCEEGFAVRPHVHNFWTRPDVAGRIARIRGMTEDAATAKIYTKPDGSLYNIGEILKNPDMANTYRHIAKYGVDDFYDGVLAKKIVDDMEANGGLIRLEDLKKCQAIETEPLTITYRGFEISTNQPPGGGIGHYYYAKNS